MGTLILSWEHIFLDGDHVPIFPHIPHIPYGNKLRVGNPWPIKRNTHSHVSTHYLHPTWGTSFRGWEPMAHKKNRPSHVWEHSMFLHCCSHKETCVCIMDNINCSQWRLCYHHNVFCKTCMISHRFFPKITWF
jgi:hypothetical protein